MAGDDAYEKALSSIQSCVQRSDSMRADHAAMGVSHDGADSYLKTAADAADALGDDGANMRKFIAGARSHLEKARSSHGAIGSGLDALQRAHDIARLAVEGIRTAQGGSDGWTDPTVDQAENAAGGMTSSGPSATGNAPRDFSPAGIHARDRRNAVDSAYRQKIEEMRRRH